MRFRYIIVQILRQSVSFLAKRVGERQKLPGRQLLEITRVILRSVSDRSRDLYRLSPCKTAFCQVANGWPNRLGCCFHTRKISTKFTAGSTVKSRQSETLLYVLTLTVKNVTRLLIGLQMIFCCSALPSWDDCLEYLLDGFETHVRLAVIVVLVIDNILMPNRVDR